MGSGSSTSSAKQKGSLITVKPSQPHDVHTLARGESEPQRIGTTKAQSNNSEGTDKRILSSTETQIPSATTSGKRLTRGFTVADLASLHYSSQVRTKLPLRYLYLDDMSTDIGMEERTRHHSISLAPLSLASPSLQATPTSTPQKGAGLAALGKLDARMMDLGGDAATPRMMPVLGIAPLAVVDGYSGSRKSDLDKSGDGFAAEEEEVPAPGGRERGRGSPTRRSLGRNIMEDESDWAQVGGEEEWEMGLSMSMSMSKEWSNFMAMTGMNKDTNKQAITQQQQSQQQEEQPVLDFDLGVEFGCGSSSRAAAAKTRARARARARVRVRARVSKSILCRLTI